MLKKLIIVSAFVFALAVVAPASAATIGDADLTFDGNPNVSVGVNDSFTARLRYDVGPAEDIESIMTDFLSEGRPPVCHVINPQSITTGIHENNLMLTAPQAPGTYDVRIRLFGDPTPGANLNCSGSPVAGGTKTFSNRVTVTGDSQDSTIVSGGTGSTASSYTPSWFSPFQTSLDALMKLVAELTKKVTEGNVGAPAPLSEKCTQLMNASAGTYYGSSNAQSLQQYLIANGFSIPAGATGYWGSQTQNAYNAFKLANSCK